MKSPVIYFCNIAAIMSMLFFCSCSKRNIEKIPEPQKDVKVLFESSTNNIVYGDTDYGRINRLQFLVFDNEGSFIPSLSSYITDIKNQTNLIKTDITFPAEYLGKTVSVYAIANEKAETESILSINNLQSLLTNVSQDNLAKNGFPMSSEAVEFVVKENGQNFNLEFSPVHSVITAVVAPDSPFSLKDLKITIKGSQYESGYLFNTENAVDNTNLQDYVFRGDIISDGKPALIHCFYPTAGDIKIIVEADKTKFPQLIPAEFTINKEDAIRRNQSYNIDISMKEVTGEIKLSIDNWELYENVLDFTIYDKAELKDFSVNIGTKVIPLTNHGNNNFSLVLNGEKAEHLIFPISEGATISPDPEEVFLKYGKYKSQEFVITSQSGINEFRFNVKYYPDPLYTFVVVGDTEWNMRGYTIEQATSDADKIAKIKNEGRHYFKNHPAFKYNPELLMVVGDISNDRDNNPDDFLKVFNSCYNSGIKCLNIYGNHDWEPYQWGDGSYGYSEFGGGKAALEATKQRIRKAAEKSGIELSYLGGNPGGWGDPEPYAFTYRGVKYYCGNSFWFTPFYKTWLILPPWAPSFSPADPKISLLEEMVIRDLEFPAIWLQHYPFSDNSEWENMWWNDFIVAGGEQTRFNSKEKRENEMKRLISMTKNPVCFAGHTHYPRSASHTTDDNISFAEYVTPYFREGGGSGYFVLVSEREGVLAVDLFYANDLL